MSQSLARPDRIIVLASSSQTRRAMLEAAGLRVDVRPARVDEEAIRAALQAEGASPRDVADVLAESKARRVAERDPAALVLGADQVLICGDRIFSKPDTPEDAVAQILSLAGRTHMLYSAAVVYEAAGPVWRHISEAELRFHPVSADLARDYVARNWDSIRHSVGAYQIEGEAVRFVADLRGDWFTVLGLPLIPLLTWLRARGDIAA